MMEKIYWKCQKESKDTSKPHVIKLTLSLISAEDVLRSYEARALKKWK